MIIKEHKKDICKVHIQTVKLNTNIDVKWQSIRSSAFRLGEPLMCLHKQPIGRRTNQRQLNRKQMACHGSYHLDAISSSSSSSSLQVANVKLQIVV